MNGMNGKEEDIDSIMRDMESMTPKSGDTRKAFDVFDAQRSPESETKTISDSVDAKSLWSSVFVKDPIKPGKVHPSKPTNERYYDFTHQNIGYALIFNQMRIKGESERNGSEKDAHDLGIALAELGFDVKIFNDFTVREIRQKLHTSE